jgi:hypothetical protein
MHDAPFSFLPVHVNKRCLVLHAKTVQLAQTTGQHGINLWAEANGTIFLFVFPPHNSFNI